MADTLSADLSERARVAAADRGAIKFSFVHPPIPIRRFDWFAHFDNDEPNDQGNMLHGYGATQAEALADLLDNYEDTLPPTHCSSCRKAAVDVLGKGCSRGGCPMGEDA